MRMHLWIASVLVGLGGLFGHCKVAAEYTLYIVEPAITDHVVAPEGPLPVVCREGRSLRVRACRGEYEPASFVVDTPKPLAAVRVTVGPVRGPDKQWPDDAIDVRVVANFRRLPILLVHDEGLLRWLPAPTDADQAAVKPVPGGALRDAAELLPVEIENRRQFWITVHVPDDASAGLHTATLTIAPANGVPAELTLDIEVYPFDLREPMVEYSIYYPTYVDVPLPANKARHFGVRSEAQYVAELTNMFAHGVSNPNLYQGVSVRPDGSLDFSMLDRLLTLREAVGMRPQALYLLGHAFSFRDRDLTVAERQTIHRHVREINDWARQRGYAEVFFAAADEWWGEQLSRERDSILAVAEAGGKVFTAVMHASFFERVGDILHCPVLQSSASMHVNFAFLEFREKYGAAEATRRTAEIGGAGRFELMTRNPKFRKAIDGVHRAGHKIFTYMNPLGGAPYPDLQRRNEGLGLWRVGFDGTMTWAYTHIEGDPVDQAMHFAKVYRTEDGVVDTVYWEGFREGVDDMRYLTTLYAALRAAAGRFPDEPLVAATHEWLRQIDVARGDLDAIRAEMARRIVALRDLGYKELPPETLLDTVDVEGVRIIPLPEPWHFKMDAADQGLDGRWFDPAVDDAGWAALRTDTGEKGWGSDPGFGWYRNRLPLSGAAARPSICYLYFEACDEETWVYLNGRRVFEHSVRSTGLLPSEIWLQPFLVPLPNEVLQGEGRDLLAVRVYNCGGMGGIWKPVRLILSEQELSQAQVEALVAGHADRRRDAAP